MDVLYLKINDVTHNPGPTVFLSYISLSSLSSLFFVSLFLSNLGSLVLEATALPTEPQPLPKPL